MKGSLYLIPSTLSGEESLQVIPEYIKGIINTIDTYIAEDERTARRYLKKMGIQKPISELKFFILNSHTEEKEIPSFLRDIDSGKNIGLISEAGCPCIADPGSAVVALAHQKNIKVIPLVGPSSILLALMASGLNGQNFCFNGYLPKDRTDRIKKLLELEQLAHRNNQSQLFIETPYRNNHLLEDILSQCKSHTKLCLAVDITGTNEFIKTLPVSEWKKEKPDLDKRPAIFILGK